MPDRLPPIAHHRPEDPPEKAHLLVDHLEAVAARAAAFAQHFDAAEWARLAGLWHDLGKFSPAFQNYIRSCTDPDVHSAEIQRHVDHSTAGARHFIERSPLLGYPGAYAVAGHHAGLPDGRSSAACLEKRLQKPIDPWREYAPPHLLEGTPETAIPPAFRQALKTKDGFRAAFLVRMLFSCLVDADFLDTEAYMQPEQARARPDWPPDILSRMDDALTQYVSTTFGTPKTRVDTLRREVRDACLRSASQSPGFFSLTVPTGGGKTLASLAFALRHAILHNLSRIVYVAPLTTIIEQNADVFRKALQAVSNELDTDVVLEHHSNFDPEKETAATRLAAENWDAPLIVTTAVQFYESLFSNKPSRCRKLHRLARAVIVLDEAQTLPVHYLHPCLRTLRELTESCGATVVLCTATQPAVRKRDDFPIGLPDIREIVPDPRRLYTALRRVRVRNLGPRSDEDLVARLCEHPTALCIVNTRKHARAIFQMLEKRTADKSSLYHLSAAMCPEHRTAKLHEILDKLQSGKPVRLVSTQLIEAGVDIDFPVVFRALAGIDSIAQAAGRCNREGRLSDLGTLFLFRSGHAPAERFLRTAADCAAQVLDMHPDPLEIDAVTRYFHLYYWNRSAQWDAKDILDKFRIVNDPRFPFLFDFREAAAGFRLIEDEGRPVIIPWEEKGEMLVDVIRANPFPERQTLRRLQRYTVRVPARIWQQHIGRTIELLHERFPVLTAPSVYYKDSVGLDLENPDFSACIA